MSCMYDNTIIVLSGQDCCVIYCFLAVGMISAGMMYMWSNISHVNVLSTDSLRTCMSKLWLRDIQILLRWTILMIDEIYLTGCIKWHCLFFDYFQFLKYIVHWKLQNIVIMERRVVFIKFHLFEIKTNNNELKRIYSFCLNKSSKA